VEERRLSAASSVKKQPGFSPRGHRSRAPYLRDVGFHGPVPSEDLRPARPGRARRQSCGEPPEKKQPQGRTPKHLKATITNPCTTVEERRFQRRVKPKKASGLQPPRSSFPRPILRDVGFHGPSLWGTREGTTGKGTTSFVLQAARKKTAARRTPKQPQSNHHEPMHNRGRAALSAPRKAAQKASGLQPPWSSFPCPMLRDVGFHGPSLWGTRERHDREGHDFIGAASRQKKRTAARANAETPQSNHHEPMHNRGRAALSAPRKAAQKASGLQPPWSSFPCPMLRDVGFHGPVPSEDLRPARPGRARRQSCGEPPEKKQPQGRTPKHLKATITNPCTTVEERRFQRRVKPKKASGLQPLWSSFPRPILRDVGFHGPSLWGTREGTTGKGTTSFVLRAARKKEQPQGRTPKHLKATITNPCTTVEERRFQRRVKPKKASGLQPLWSSFPRPILRDVGFRGPIPLGTWERHDREGPDFSRAASPKKGNRVPGGHRA
jgi:hypothetical protein